MNDSHSFRIDGFHKDPHGLPGLKDSTQIVNRCPGKSYIVQGTGSLTAVSFMNYE